MRQKIDQLAGKRQWKATVTDPDEPTAKRASFEITLIADVQPVPTTTKVLPGMRPIALAAASTLPWWILAAIESAECQAREYETGNNSEGS